MAIGSCAVGAAYTAGIGPGFQGFQWKSQEPSGHRVKIRFSLSSKRQWVVSNRLRIYRKYGEKGQEKIAVGGLFFLGQIYAIIIFTA